MNKLLDVLLLVAVGTMFGALIALMTTGSAPASAQHGGASITYSYINSNDGARIVTDDTYRRTSAAMLSTVRAFAQSRRAGSSNAWRCTGGSDISTCTENVRCRTVGETRVCPRERKLHVRGCGWDQWGQFTCYFGEGADEGRVTISNANRTFRATFYFDDEGYAEVGNQGWFNYWAPAP